jgi:hypothetical protein
MPQFFASSMLFDIFREFYMVMDKNTTQANPLLDFICPDESTVLSMDIYNQTRQILHNTNIALGREVKIEVTSASSTNLYSLPKNDQSTSFQI